MKRIKKIGVYQAAKIAAIIYFLFTAIFMVPFGLSVLAFGSDKLAGAPFSGALFYVLAPFAYAFIAFIMTVLGCLAYNLIVKWTGGIEIEVENIS